MPFLNPAHVIKRNEQYNLMINFNHEGVEREREREREREGGGEVFL